MAEQSRFTPHPLVAKLTSGGGETGAIKLLGYFGGASEGLVKVYPSLDDLSTYYRIREGDILHVEDAAAEELPHGGSAIWVQADARVDCCKTQQTAVQARFLAGDIAARMARGPAVTYRSPARQAIVPETGGGGACAGGSVWPCSVVYGYCLASNDMPCAYTEQYWCPGEVYTAASCYTCAGYTCVQECVSVVCPPLPTRGRFACEVYSRDVVCRR